MADSDNMYKCDQLAAALILKLGLYIGHEDLVDELYDMMYEDPIDAFKAT